MGDLREETGPSPDLSAVPTGVRHGVLGIATVMAVLLYLDRICMAAAIKPIGDEFGLSMPQRGWILGAFFLSYGIVQVPAGWLGDLLGPRRILAASVLVWSLFTGLTGLASGLATLVALRLLLGLGQAAAYPVAARIFSQWIPFHRRALANSIITLGGRGGGALAPWLTAWFVVTWGGWRSVFGLYGLLRVAWTALFWLWFRNTPREHPGCNRPEVDYIENSRPAGATNPNAPARDIPWGPLLRSRSLWLQCVMQFFGNVSWTFAITWAPTFFESTYHVGLERAGFLAGVPLQAAMVGCLLGGLATDALTRRLGLRWGRSLLAVAGKFLAVLGVMGCLVAPTPTLAALALAFAYFTNDLGLAATWAYFQDAGGPYVATFLGWANMFGNVGAFASPLLLGYLARGSDWSGALGVCAASYLVAGLCWIWIDSRVPIVPTPGGVRGERLDEAHGAAAA